MLVTEIIKRVRAKAQDNSEIKYSDYDIIRAINIANKVYRSVCKTEAPEFLSAKYSCTLEKGENIIIFGTEPEGDETDYTYIECSPVRILSVKCNNRIMHKCNPFDIDDIGSEGTPNHYTLMNVDGELSMELYPAPSGEAKVDIIAIDETTELTAEGSINAPNDFVEYIIDFVVNSLAGANDVGEFKDGVRKALQDFLPTTCVVDSYY